MTRGMIGQLVTSLLASSVAMVSACGQLMASRWVP